VTYFENDGEFRQRFTVTAGTATVGGHLFYQMCSDITGQCINYEEDFTIQLTAQSSDGSEEATGDVAFNVLPDAESAELSDGGIEEEAEQPANVQEKKQGSAPQVPSEAVEASAEKEKAS